MLVKTQKAAKTLKEIAPFTEAYPVPESGARYYLCHNGSCDRPVDSVSKVRRLLEYGGRHRGKEPGEPSAGHAP